MHTKRNVWSTDAGSSYAWGSWLFAFTSKLSSLSWTVLSWVLFSRMHMSHFSHSQQFRWILERRGYTKTNLQWEVNWHETDTVLPAVIVCVTIFYLEIRLLQLLYRTLNSVLLRTDIACKSVFLILILYWGSCLFHFFWKYACCSVFIIFRTVHNISIIYDTCMTFITARTSTNHFVYLIILIFNMTNCYHTLIHFFSVYPSLADPHRMQVQ